jgi:hypothetical protein
MKLKRRARAFLTVCVGKPIGHLVNKATASRFRSLGGMIAALFFMSIFVLLPSVVEAQCKQWDISGKWVLNVTKGVSEELSLKQDGNNVSGKSFAYSGGQA